MNESTDPKPLETVQDLKRHLAMHLPLTSGQLEAIQLALDAAYAMGRVSVLEEEAA